jgi:CRP/FNR family cyclic AMP-dependent transcriptional regulator
VKIAHEFFVVVDGEAEVTRNGKRVATRGGGEFFAEIALLLQIPLTATATAKTPLRFFVLASKSFRQLVDENPSVERKLLPAPSRRLVELSNDPTLA